MRITQGAFSFLPDLTDDEIRAQIEYASTTAGRSRSSTPTTRIPATSTGRCGACRCSTSRTPRRACCEVNACRKAHPSHYIRVNAFDCDARRRVDVPVVHRQPPERGARLPPRAAGARGPQAALHDASLRGRQGRPARYESIGDARRRSTTGAPTVDLAGRSCARPTCSEVLRSARPRAGRARAGEARVREIAALLLVSKARAPARASRPPRRRCT